MIASSPAPFLILSLPRSRSAWLSYFLTYGDWQCLHDEARHWRGLEDVRTACRLPQTGFAETSISSFWRLIPKLSPDCRVVIVRRSSTEVLSSLALLGCAGERVTDWVRGQERKLEQAGRRLPNVMTVHYHDLNNEATIARLFEFCLLLPFDRAWWLACSLLNIQCNFRGLQRYALAYRAGMDRTARQARAVILADLHRKRVTGADEISLAEEDVTEFFSANCDAFRDHSAAIGESPDSYTEKNVPLMARLQTSGALRLLVARSNGKIFGYLMTLLSPSLERLGSVSAIHTLFYASQEFPGLGLRLQREMASRLRGHVDEIFFRAGPRGDGPRSGVLALRQGALPAGELFRLELN